MLTLRLHHADDDLNLPPGDEPQTTRLWLSDQQWLSILERIERRSRETRDNPPAVEERRDPSDPRRPHDTTCLMRVGAHGPDSGTYLVRTRNISSGGMGFIHQDAITTGTRCTIAIQTANGSGVIAAGRIAWCREVTQLEVEDALFEVGIQFDRPINLDPFFGNVA